MKVTTMNTNPIRVAVTGITGRMGSELVRCIIRHQEQKKINKTIVLGAAIDRSNSGSYGIDIGTFMKLNAQNIIITDNIELVKDDFDVLIDFTSPSIFNKYLTFCELNNKNMVIGTTGLNQIDKSLIKTAAKKIGIVCSSNFSLGMNIMLKLLSEVSKIIGDIVDIDIIEYHHNKKEDIPSGTALMMCDVIRSSMKKIGVINQAMNHNGYCNDILKEIYFLSQSNRDPIIHSVRAGNTVGKHTVLFESTEECLEIKHKAFNRTVFVNGALYAAAWLGINRVGLFNFNDIINI